VLPDGTRHGFAIDAFRKHCLLHGLDDIGLTLQARRRDPRLRGTPAGRRAVAVRLTRADFTLTLQALGIRRNVMKILMLPGDGIGPEVIAEALKVLRAAPTGARPWPRAERGLLGGAAIDACGKPLPDETLAKARAADAILLGAVGGPKWDTLDRALRPEKGLLAIRAELGLFGNLRPAILYPELAGASALKAEVVAGSIS
jgi:hypothetical protein